MDNFELDVPHEIIKMASGMAIGVGKSGCICGASQRWGAGNKHVLR